MGKSLETRTTKQDGANMQSQKPLKTICITISIGISCMLLVVSIPILIAHLNNESTDESSTVEAVSTQSAPVDLNQTISFLVQTPYDHDTLMPDAMDMPFDSPQQIHLKPITGPTHMRHNIKMPPQDGSSCQCRSPFQPAHNCALCFHIPIRSAFHGFVAAELYNKTGAIQECSEKLGGEIPHSKFRFSSVACLRP